MELLKESEKEDIIITAYGKPLAVLHHVTEDALSDYLIENDPAFKKRIENAYSEYALHGGITADAPHKKVRKTTWSKKGLRSYSALPPSMMSKNSKLISPFSLQRMLGIIWRFLRSHSEKQELKD